MIFRPSLVYLTVFVVASCGLGYELVASTVASYVLGDTVTQFSTVIGAYLSAMGLGSYLSKYIDRGLARRFVETELAVALVGGLSAVVLMATFGQAERWFRPMLYGIVLITGCLVGLEIPLALRLLKESVGFKDLVAEVLTFDYLGSLAASILFPMFALPHLGLVRASLLFGIANALIGLWSTWIFAEQIGRVGLLRARGVFVLLVLLAAFAYGERLTTLSEEAMYPHPVVLARTTPYQRIVLTRTPPGGFELFLNGHLQFASSDEYRYHEALVHPAFGLNPQAKSILVLGGGDGLAVREILKHPAVKRVLLVDIDPEMTRLARENPEIVALNHGSLNSPLVEVRNEDAFAFIRQSREMFDIAIVDFPDPHNFAIGKLYSTHFFKALKARLDPELGAASVQTTSPLNARHSFWCINQTLEAAGFSVRPMHALVPSFGEWGYSLASSVARPEPTEVPPGLRYLDLATLHALFAFGPDLARVPVETNRLNNQVLVRYYQEELAAWP
ncbi:MAG: polyamine aminopropyltransferase [Vicinamibacteria bacterium]